jgi:hypothetical protein
VAVASVTPKVEDRGLADFFAIESPIAMVFVTERVTDTDMASVVDKVSETEAA